LPEIWGKAKSSGFTEQKKGMFRKACEMGKFFADRKAAREIPSRQAASGITLAANKGGWYSAESKPT